MSGLERSNTPITAAIVSKNHLVHLGLQAVVKSQQHIRLIGAATSAVEAEELIAREKPQVIIIELEPEIDIMGLVRKMKTSVPTTKIVLLSGIEDKHRAWEALSSGVDGIVLSIQPPAALLAIIDYVCHGQAKTIPDELNGTGRLNGLALGISNAGPSSPRSSDALTKREREIIDLIGQGLSNKDIADHLCICSTTVRHHLTSIFDKLGVTSRQKLLIRAHQHGLVEFRTFA